MAHTVTLNAGSAASQAEGNGGGAASFTFNLTRQPGDDAETSYRYIVVNTTGGGEALSDDFTVNAATFNWANGDFAEDIVLTSVQDTNVEAAETFSLWIYRGASGTPYFKSANITLTNDDSGPPVFTSSATFSAAENQTAVGTVAATSSNTVAYTIVGGADAALFTIADPATGVLTFNGAKNFESPDDSDANRIYQVKVRATAGGVTSDQDITVNLTNVNEAIAIDGADPLNVAVNENATTVLQATATDIDAGDTVAWSISGGADAAKFTISSTGLLSFASAASADVAADANADNIYNVEIKATDSGGLFDTQLINVTLNAIPEPPVITSNGGGPFAFLSVAENSTAVTTATATDEESQAITWSLGGTDAAAFGITAGGVLTFNVAPDYELPTDTGQNNVFEVQVIATAGGQTDTQDLIISVTNVPEAGDPPPPSGGGVVTPPPAGGGTSGNDNLVGTSGPDSRAGGEGNDTIDGGNGADWLDGDNGNDSLSGSDGDDFIRGLGDNDVVDGGEGADTVNGNLGTDTVRGGNGNDVVYGGQGNDEVFGGEGDDSYVNGNIGNDTVHGDGGADAVYGGQNDDWIYGDSGTDTMSGDLGNDILFGGADADRFTIAAGGGIDWVGDFSADSGDRILLAPGTTYAVSNVSGQVFITIGGGAASIGLAGVAFSSFDSGWIVFG